MVAWSGLAGSDAYDVLGMGIGCIDNAEEVAAAAGAHRRRVINAACCAAEAIAEGNKQCSGPQGPKRKDGAPFSWAEHCARLTEKDFKRRYRLTHAAFYKLLGWIEPKVKVKSEKQARNGRGGVEPVGNEVKLALTLRFLAGGAVEDIRLIYHVDRSYVYTCIWKVIDAINNTLRVEFPIDNVEELKVLEREFRSRSKDGVWEGQVGALDSVHFPMHAPGNHEVPNPLRYYVARKDEYALLCMTMCDADRRFTVYRAPSVATRSESLQTFSV
jgi:hypothetical protein